MKSLFLIFSALLIAIAPAANAGIDEGKAAYQRGDYMAAILEIFPLAEQGNATAQIILGNMYLLGLGVAKSEEEAVRWYQKAAIQGDKSAQEALHRRGLLSLPQIGVTRYSAEPIAATVVDEENGRPLEGANVVAVWHMRGPYGGRGGGTLEMIEDVTGKDGRFHIPGWGPKTVPSKYRHGTRLEDEDPVLIIFKAGYSTKYVDNQGRFYGEGLDTGPAVRSSIWNGKTIKLAQFKGELKAYASRNRDPYGDYGSGIECWWKKIPRAYATLIKENERMASLGIKPVPGGIDFPSLQYLDQLFSSPNCGSAKAVFEEHLK